MKLRLGRRNFQFGRADVRRAQSLATPLDVQSGVSPDILRASVLLLSALKFVLPTPLIY